MPRVCARQTSLSCGLANSRGRGLNPSPDTFTWDWLDSAIDTLGQAGLNIVLGTPTATPPRWMVDKYPRYARPAGAMDKREDSARAVIIAFPTCPIATKPPVLPAFWQPDMAKIRILPRGKLITNMAVITRHSPIPPPPRTDFAIGLAQKYQSIDALNRAWGNVFLVNGL